MRRVALTLGCLLVVGCTLDNPTATPAALDRDLFECDVVPVLVARCGFYACHGSVERPFHLFGPNRLRLGVTEEERAISLTPAERDRNYAMGLSFAEPAAGYQEPLLVVKPLDEALGGAYHEGAQLYGGADVFVDADDPDLAILRDWTNGATRDEECVP